MNEMKYDIIINNNDDEMIMNEWTINEKIILSSEWIMKCNEWMMIMNNE